MVDIFRPPYFQPVSVNGVPLAGAKLYFYTAGTTTPITVYQDVGLSTPHASPVVADASGIFAAIYVNTATYKIALYTSADVLVKTYDNVNSPSLFDSLYIKGSDIASASTLDLDSATGPFIDITGTTTVTGVTLTAGRQRMARATGAFRLTASSTLVVNGSTTNSYTTAAQDLLLFEGYSAGVVRVWVISTPLYGLTSYPPGTLYGLTLSNNSGTPNDKIDMAVGSARDDADAANMDWRSALTAKDITTAWAVGSSAGLLDTGSVGNNDYYLWGIKRPDTGVTDLLGSLSGTAPTMPTNYTIKVLLGKFTRTGAVNKAPRSYSLKEATQWVAYTPTVTGLGTLASGSVFSRRVGDSLEIMGRFVTGTHTGTEARISMGFGGTDSNVVSDSTKVASIRMAGTIVDDVTGAFSVYVLTESATGYLTLGLQSSTSAGLTKITGTTLTNAQTMSIRALIPIAGW